MSQMADLMLMACTYIAVMSDGVYGSTRIIIISTEGLCARSRNQWQGQEIKSHRHCGMGVITCPCHWYLFLAHRSLITSCDQMQRTCWPAENKFLKPKWQSMTYLTHEVFFWMVFGTTLVSFNNLHVWRALLRPWWLTWYKGTTMAVDDTNSRSID